jgi:anaerobic magnesium-protoporphyrin IX monomethyl ester cyclase
MRVLLINPPYSAEERYGKDLKNFGPLNEPLGLAYLASNLEKAGHEVLILDALALELSSDQICDYIKIANCDLIGITMLTPMYHRSIEVVNAVKNQFPIIPIVVGGPHPTILPEETLRENNAIDFVVVGEGEIILLNLVNALEKKQNTHNIEGIAYRKKDTIVVNPPPSLISDLDDLPAPARHLLPMDIYQITRSRTKSNHAYTVSVARGCPFNCAFCCRIFGKKVRHHSVNRIIEEILSLIDNYNAKEINLEADTLTVNKKFISALCDALISSGISRQISWTCESRIDTVDEELLLKMKEAGCWQTSYGVETGSQRLLELIHKDISIQKIEETFAITKKAGISIRAFYMLGIPTETKKESLATIAFAKKLDANWSQFTLFTPFPGTELYNMVVNEGGIASHNWSDYKTHGGWTKGSLAYVPKGRSIDEMKSLQKKAYRVVYLRPKVILRFAKDINSFGKILEYMLGFWVVFKTIIPIKEDSKKVIRIDRNDLKKFSKDVYVDSPVYFSENRFVRFINWHKLDSTINLLPKQDNQIILDFACGNGVMLPTLAKLFKIVVGIDLHTTAATRLKQKYKLDNVITITANGLTLPFKNNFFTTIVSTSTLEHFFELDKVIKELARIIKPGGHLVFLVPTENLFYGFGRTLMGYTKPEDHYHSAKEIEKVIKKYFNYETKKTLPFNLPGFISVYTLGRVTKI